MAGLIDHPIIIETLFYPTRITPSSVRESPGGAIHLIPAGSDRLGAYLYRPDPSAPVILFFHGNGEVMTDYLSGFHADVARAGAGFMVVDYRGYGLSSGSPNLSRLKEDALAAWNYARGELGLDEDDIIIMGRSLGSLAALCVAGGPGANARGLIVESGIAKLEEWMERMAHILAAMGIDVPALSAELGRHFDHQAAIRKFTGPLLIMHAPRDEIVPKSHAENLASWADPQKARLVIFDQGGHNDIHFVNRERYFHEMSRFLEKSGGNSKRRGKL